jgi:hypothetical protein
MWRPGPDSTFKRRLASEALKELMTYRVENPREVYVRNFNVADPELDFVDRDGKDNLQGCSFDAGVHPDCAWHLYGMSSRDKLKRDVLARALQAISASTGLELTGEMIFTHSIRFSRGEGRYRSRIRSRLSTNPATGPSPETVSGFSTTRGGPLL